METTEESRWWRDVREWIELSSVCRLSALCLFLWKKEVFPPAEPRDLS